MSILNPFAIGFACVAAGFFVGADYVVQSKANGSYPGEYAFSKYLESYGIRFDETVADADKARRQAQEARIHLPETINGWERVEWDIAAIDMKEVTAGMNMVEKMRAKEEMLKSLKMANYHAWEYRRGDEVVRISAQFELEPEKKDTAASGWLTGTFHGIKEPHYRPHSVIQGVPFLAVDDLEDPEAVNHLLLEAHMGDEITLAVASDAKEEAVLEVLEAINIGELNLMLEEPLAGVGPDAPDLTHKQKMSLGGLYARSLNSGDPIPMAMLNGILEGKTWDEVDPDAVATLEAEQEEEPVAAQIETEGGNAVGSDERRLQLSGGRTCLSGGGRLCN